MSNNNSFQVFKGGWSELSNAVFTTNQRTVPALTTTFFIKPDGVQLFSIQGTTVQTRPMSVSWDIESAGTVTNTFDTSTEDSNPIGLFFKDDGTKMFILGGTSTNLFQYDLTADPWNVSIATIEETNTLSGITSPETLFFSRDGDFVYIIDSAVTIVYRFEVSPNWDINTLGTLTQFNTGISGMSSLVLKPEGDLMFIGDITVPKEITQFTLSPPYSIDPAPTVTSSLTITQNPSDLFVRGNGMQLFIGDTPANTINKFQLLTQWEISTASLFTNQISVTSAPRSVFWTPNGTKMYVIDSSTDLFTQFDADSNAPFNLNALTEIATFAQANENTPQGAWWRNDGTQLFIVGVQNSTIDRYNTSVAFSVGDLLSGRTDTYPLPGGSGVPTGLWFSNDGTTMLVSTVSPSEILQFNLSAPYVLPTTPDTADKTLVIPIPDNINPRDLFLKADGLQLFLPSAVGDTVGRYKLTTPLGKPTDPNPFDISTAVLADELDLSFLGPNNVQGIFIKPDGKQIFITDINQGDILSFDLSLDFNNAIITNLGDELTTQAGDTLVFVQ